MKYLMILIIPFLFSCSKNEKSTQITSVHPPKTEIAKKDIPVSFELGSQNSNAGLIVFYTTDSDSLWLNSDWVDKIKNKMEARSNQYSTVLLFNSKNNTPNVISKGLDYPMKYDRYMVCGYWKYPNGNTQFCYGGMKSDGNFKVCTN